MEVRAEEDSRLGRVLLRYFKLRHRVSVALIGRFLGIFGIDILPFRVLEDLERDPTSFYNLENDSDVIRAYERKRREVLKKERSKLREQNGGLIKQSASTSRKEHQGSFTVRAQA